MALKDNCVELTSRQGWHGFMEHPDFPTKINSRDILDLLSEDPLPTHIFIPADLVPESDAARKIKNAGIDLRRRYVVYCQFRRGIGNDPTYG